jgi:hypothetical protein
MKLSFNKKRGLSARQFPQLFSRSDIVAKRIREIVVRFHVTEQERNLIDEKMAAAGIRNRESYLRKMSLGGYILRLDLSNVKEMTRLLSNVANNMNQIAKRANETRSIYAADMIQLREEVGNMRSQVSDALKVFAKVRKLMDL